MSPNLPATTNPVAEFLPALRPVTTASTSPFEEAETIWEIDQTPHWRRDPRYRELLERSGDETGEVAISYWLATIAGVTLAGTVYGLPFFFVGAIFGFCIAGIVSVALAAPFAIAVRTIVGTWRHPLAAPCFGGIVGFLSMAPAWDALWRVPGDGGIIAFILGPMITTALGQVGGYLQTKRYMAAAIADRPEQASWRISIRAMLATTAWIAASLAALQAAGLLEPAELIAIGVWLPWQLCLLCLFWALAGRAGRREKLLGGPRFT